MAAVLRPQAARVIRRSILLLAQQDRVKAAR